jgi:TonB family protein
MKSTPRVALLFALLAGLTGLQAAEPAAADDDLVSPPLVSTWVPPVYPPQAVEQKLQGTVRVRFIVNEEGVVTKARAVQSSHPLFEAAAVQAILQWRFEPAVEGGRKVAKCVDLAVPFQLADLKRKTDPKFPPQWAGSASLRLSPTTKAAQVTDKTAEYPESLLPLLLRGEVQVGFTVDATGRVQAPKVLAATHADFVQPALAAVLQWTFRPATQGDLAVSSPMATVVAFDVNVSHSDRLAACGVTLTEPAETIATLARQPESFVVIDPVFPYDLLVAGTTGDAEVEFVIGAGGRTESVVVRKASHTVFGHALSAAVQGWIFHPARRDDAGVPVKAVLRHVFETPTGSLARLAGRVRSGDTADLGAEGLDAPLHPIYRAAPVYPAELRSEAASGQALVEFMIDRDGRARMSHVISASHEEFGWAAATAVEQWVFDPPRRDGKAVDVRVRIPFNFSPPPAATP